MEAGADTRSQNAPTANSGSPTTTPHGAATQASNPAKAMMLLVMHFAPKVHDAVARHDGKKARRIGDDRGGGRRRGLAESHACGEHRDEKAQ